MATDGSDLESIFPKLRATGYEIKSPRTRNYNCVAWAVGIDDCPWDHRNEPFTYWPRRKSNGSAVRRDGTIESLVDALETVGFAVCADATLEDGCEKVALLATNDGQWTHAARQLTDGRWTSKCGALEDINHNTLDAIACVDYGKVVRYMKRPRQPVATNP